MKLLMKLKPIAVFSLAVGLVSTLASVGVQAQIILDPPNLRGTVGLEGETFSNFSLSASWNGGSTNASIANGEDEFAIRVQPGLPFNLYVYMNYFSNTPNARTYIYAYNQPALETGEERVIDLTRPSGRINGTVDVTGGFVSSITMRSNKSLADGNFSGYVGASKSPFVAAQPVPVANGIRVYGNAVLTADAGCNIPVTLDNNYVDVAAGEVVDATWDFDISRENCDLGSLSGSVAVAGLESDGQNSDAVLRYHRVSISGPSGYKSQSLYEDGSYSIDDLNDGRHTVYHDSYFQSPYNYVRFPYSENVQINSGEITTLDLERSAATVHGKFDPSGSWGRDDTSAVRVEFHGPNGAYANDDVDRTTGDFDLVVSANVTSTLRYIQPSFYKNDGNRNTRQYPSIYYESLSDPLSTTPGVGERQDLGEISPETSVAEVIFEISNGDVLIERLAVSGNAREIDTDTNALLSRRYLNATSSGTPSNPVSVVMRGFPGVYAMTATGDGDDGGTYSASFELALGQPQNTPSGTDVLQDFSTESGEPIGTITFGNVMTPGDTTLSLVGTGPKPDDVDFKIFGGGTSLYYDVTTTASFDPIVGALVCLMYDDATLTEKKESGLKLSHYHCDEDGTNCTWTQITADGYPDTENNVICGVADSFSIFAIWEPLDDDDDGVLNSADNCVETYNPEQSDLDGDGVGDVCETDTDGDGIVDDEDRCPLDANANNEDQDGDGVGDICDMDLDGDEVDNVVDNCERIPNGEQVDFDSDGNGDACDNDADGDGLDNSVDSCNATGLGELIDNNGCSGSQRFDLNCPTDAEWRNHGQYVSCVSHEAADQVDIGLITESEKDVAVSAAAQSDVGKKQNSNQ
ncbi:thrombospondin type 3 repeat-containing protein [Pseudomonadota bacterium]